MYWTEVISYLGIPIIAALVGWGTNVLALRMTFFPLEFIGIPPYWGWQGIIPNKAKAMAEKSVDLITGKLIQIDEQFEQLDAQKIAQEMQPALNQLARKIVNEVMKAKAPLLWKAVPKRSKERIYEKATQNLPHVVIQLMEEIKLYIDDLFDIKTMVVEALVNDKNLLNLIFLECGKKEFAFIRKSGLYFGFLFGLIQMLIWYFYQPWWFLPLAGLLVGYLTNILALRMIFSPLKPYKIASFTIQGLFIKRQQEVAKDYAQLVSKNIITAPNIFDALLDGPRSEKLADLVGQHIKEVVDETAQDYIGLLRLFSNPKQYAAIKNIAAYSFMEDFPIIIREIFDYTETQLNIEATLRQRMSQLSPKEFAGFLHPVFQEDEWKLIAVGAFLGMLAGFAQYFLLF